MALPWNEIRTRAIQFAKEWEQDTRELHLPNQTLTAKPARLPAFGKDASLNKRAIGGTY
jgi:hypothetical protein